MNAIGCCRHSSRWSGPSGYLPHRQVSERELVRGKETTCGGSNSFVSGLYLPKGTSETQSTPSAAALSRRSARPRPAGTDTTGTASVRLLPGHRVPTAPGRITDMYGCTLLYQVSGGNPHRPWGEDPGSGIVPRALQTPGYRALEAVSIRWSADRSCLEPKRDPDERAKDQATTTHVRARTCPLLAACCGH